VAFNHLSPAAVDLPLLAFKERIATNLIKCDLLDVFGKSPTGSYSPQEVAAMVRRRANAVAVELQDLSLLGVLQSEPHEDELHYRLTDEPDLRELAIRYVNHNDASPLMVPRSLS
jgi:hypothetical protein